MLYVTFRTLSDTERSFRSFGNRAGEGGVGE